MSDDDAKAAARAAASSTLQVTFSVFASSLDPGVAGALRASLGIPPGDSDLLYPLARLQSALVSLGL